MNHKPFLFGAVLMLGLYGTSSRPAQAQPDANNAGKANNPANLNMGGGGRRGGGRQQLTPEQVRQMQTQQSEMRALNIKQQLTYGGFTDEATQSAVVDYFKTQETERYKLQEQWQKLNQSVRSTTTTDAQLATQLNDIRAAVDAETTRRSAAYKELSDKIELSKKPRLDALLMTMGLTGTEAAIVGQGGGGRQGGPGGMMGGPGGMGGFGGGGQGGPGGVGGPGGMMDDGGGGQGRGPGGMGGGQGGPGGGFGNGRFGGGQGDDNGPPGPPPDDMGGGPQQD